MHAERGLDYAGNVQRVNCAFGGMAAAMAADVGTPDGGGQQR